MQVSDKVQLEGLPFECGLLAVSNQLDVLAVGSSSDVRIHRLSSFHLTLESAAKKDHPSLETVATLSLSGRPTFLRMAHNEQYLVVAILGGDVNLYDLASVLSGQTSPLHTFRGPAEIIDVLPNPASDELANYIGILGREGLVIADITSKELSPIHGSYSSGTSWHILKY